MIFKKNLIQTNHHIKHRIHERIKRFEKKRILLKEQYKFIKAFWDDEIFTGMMLSDGFLRRIDDGQNSCFELAQSDKNLGLINTVEAHFNNFGINTGRFHDMKKTNDKFYWYTKLFTFRSKFFTFQRKRWYPENKKIVPDDLIITPKTLAYWFMGDGSTWTNKNRVYLVLYTQGFAETDVKKLQQHLTSFDIESYLTIVKSNNGYKLCIGKSIEIIKFLKLIEPYVIPCFQYKIKYPRFTSYKIANSMPEAKERVRLRNKKRFEDRLSKR